MELISTLQFKSSKDFLLIGFNFSFISYPFSVVKLALVEDTTLVFEKEKLSYTTIKSKRFKNTDVHSILFYSPILITADSTYKLSTCLEFDQIQELIKQVTVFRTHLWAICLYVVSCIILANDSISVKF